jgi:DNA-binding beta-propeller fold protein YncE
MRFMDYTLKFVASSLYLLAAVSPTWAAPTLTVASPANGAKVGSPAYFDATASTSSCAKGISAIRIYSAPGVNAFTTDSFHLETFLALKPGTYNTVIQAWDNCGGVSKASRTITVTAKPGVTVFLPSGGAEMTPVHMAVSAQNPGCAKGISAVRIYTAPFVAAYTLNGAALDAFIDLIPGKYNAVAQAWDNCGNVFKTPVRIVDTGGSPGKFLYAANGELNNVSKYVINAGVLGAPKGASEPPTFAVTGNANSIAIDPSGNFAYVGLGDGRISVFDINTANGDLFLRQTVRAPGHGPATVTVDRAGAFVFATE